MKTKITPSWTPLKIPKPNSAPIWFRSASHIHMFSDLFYLQLKCYNTRFVVQIQMMCSWITMLTFCQANSCVLYFVKKKYLLYEYFIGYISKGNVALLTPLLFFFLVQIKIFKRKLLVLWIMICTDWISLLFMYVGKSYYFVLTYRAVLFWTLGGDH